MNEVLDFIKVAVLAFTSLFPVVNPIGCAPIFLSLTHQYPLSAQQILSRKIALYSFIILAVSLVCGTSILNFFGISIVVIQIAGGVLLASTGFSLLNQKEEDASAGKDAPDSLEAALDHAFYPLTLPITVGPGCIAISITIGAHLEHTRGAGFIHGIPRHFIAALIGMFLLCILVLICYSKAESLARALGKAGTSILMRMSAFILFCIGVQILWNGLTSGMPQLFTFLDHH